MHRLGKKNKKNTPFWIFQNSQRAYNFQCRLCKQIVTILNFGQNLSMYFFHKYNLGGFSSFIGGWFFKLTDLEIISKPFWMVYVRMIYHSHLTIHVAKTDKFRSKRLCNWEFLMVSSEYLLFTYMIYHVCKLLAMNIAEKTVDLKLMFMIRFVV